MSLISWKRRGSAYNNRCLLTDDSSNICPKCAKSVIFRCLSSHSVFMKISVFSDFFFLIYFFFFVLLAGI